MKHAASRPLILVAVCLAVLLPNCARAGAKVVVGYSVYTMTNPYFTAMVNGFKKATHKDG